jgi:hypothetical protein
MKRFGTHNILGRYCDDIKQWSFVKELNLE